MVVLERVDDLRERRLYVDCVEVVAGVGDRDGRGGVCSGRLVQMRVDEAKQRRDAGRSPTCLISRATP
jgi:hypothetical protein